MYSAQPQDVLGPAVEGSRSGHRLTPVKDDRIPVAGTFYRPPIFLAMLSRRATTATLVALEVPELGARPPWLKAPLDPWSGRPGLSGNELSPYGSVVLHSARRNATLVT